MYYIWSLLLTLFTQGVIQYFFFLRSCTGAIWFSCMGSPVGSFGLSTFSRVFCQSTTTHPQRQLTPYSLVHCHRIVWYIAAVQFGTLPPYSLVNCRRTVWCIFEARFGLNEGCITFGYPCYVYDCRRHCGQDVRAALTVGICVSRCMQVN